MERSLTKTLARKYRISVPQACRRYRADLDTERGPRRAFGSRWTGTGNRRWSRNGEASPWLGTPRHGSSTTTPPASGATAPRSSSGSWPTSASYADREPGRSAPGKRASPVRREAVRKGPFGTSLAAHPTARWVRREAARKRPASMGGTGPRRAAHPVTPLCSSPGPVRPSFLWASHRAGCLLPGRGCPHHVLGVVLAARGPVVRPGSVSPAPADAFLPHV
jgi:hypothetical protein